MTEATLSSESRAAAISSELVEYRNAAGLRIAAYFDRPTEGPLPQKFAVMAPKYGETKKNNLQLAYQLAANGMAVLRFDLTNHIGESEGAMEQFTMPGAVDDIVASIEYLERRFDAAEITLIASSLSARCALRAAVLVPRLKRLVCLVGVVNLQQTIFEVYKEDYFGAYRKGSRHGVMDCLGFNVDAENFIESAMESHLHDLDGTLRDVAALSVPVDYFYAENDVWVRSQDVLAAFSGRLLCRLLPVREAMHELRENPSAADAVYRTIVSECVGVSEPALAAAPLKAVLAQNRVERNRLKRIAPDASDEHGFWSRYFDKYKIVEHSDTYQDYMELVGQLLGPFRGGQCILDAGCGNGLFGVWLARHLRRRAELPGDGAQPIYVGVDLTTRGLADAVMRQSEARAPGRGREESGVDLFYTLADFDLFGHSDSPAQSRLPFADTTFDAVCCSLVVSYLKSPDKLMAELHRVLRPGGALVISSLKPDCDLSALYRGFLDQQVTEVDAKSARQFLSAASIIRLKAEAGHYHFYSEAELVALAEAAGFSGFETVRSIGNQANVLRALK